MVIANELGAMSSIGKGGLRTVGVGKPDGKGLSGGGPFRDISNDFPHPASV